MKDIVLGLLFIGTLVVLSVATVTVGKFTLFKQGSYIQIEFDDARGIQDGDSVFADGVNVGQVSDVRLQDDKIIVSALIEENLTLYSDYKITIEESSLVGGRLISIKRGTSTESKVSIEQSTVLRGSPSSSLLTTANEILEENRDDIKATVKNLRDVSERIGESIRNNEGTLARFVNSNEIYKELESALSNVIEITDNVLKGKGSMGKMLTDSSLYDRSNEMITEIKEFIDNLQNGKGTVAKLISDEGLAQDLGDTMSNLKKSTDIIREMLEEAKEKDFMGKLMNTIEGADNTIGKAGRAKLYLKLSYFNFNETDSSVSRLGLDYWPSDDKFFYFGASQLSFDEDSSVLFEDQVEKNDSQSFLKPEFQIGYIVPWFLNKSITVRAGLIEGKPGGGVDLDIDRLIALGHPVKIRLEVRQAYNDLEDENIDELIDGSMMRAYIKTPLMDKREKWWQKILSSINLFAGYSRIGSDPEFMAGISLEYIEDDIRALVGLLGSGI